MQPSAPYRASGIDAPPNASEEMEDINEVPQSEK